MQINDQPSARIYGYAFLVMTFVGWIWRLLRESE
jgi:hypothetical protein